MSSTVIGLFSSHQEWQVLQMSAFFFLIRVIIHKRLRKIDKISRKSHSEVETKHGTINFFRLNLPLGHYNTYFC